MLARRYFAWRLAVEADYDEERQKKRQKKVVKRRRLNVPTRISDTHFVQQYRVGSPEPSAASTLGLLPVAVTPTPIQEVVKVDCIIEERKKPGEGGQSGSTIEAGMVNVSATSPTPHHAQSSQRHTEPRRVIRGRRRLLHSPAPPPPHSARRVPRRHFNATEQFLNSDKHWRNLAREFVTEHVRLREKELQQQSQWQTLFAKFTNAVEIIANKIDSK